MAIQRLTLAQIAANILEIMGYKSSTQAPWSSDDTLYLRINEYGQRLPMRLNTIAAQMEIPTPVRFSMWRTVADSGTATITGIQVAAGSATCYLPVNYDHWISFYNLTDSKAVYPIKDSRRWEIDELVTSPPGMVRYIDIGGFTTEGVNWRRLATLYPTPISGNTPSIRLEYYRLPAAMSVVGDYPDVDPKYESIFIYGTITDLARSTGQEFDRYAALEKEMLVEMLSTCRSV